MLAGLLETVPDLRVAMEVVAVEGDRRVTRERWSGHAADGGGAVEVEMWGMSTVVGERNVASELYETEEEARRALTAGEDREGQAAAEGEYRRLIDAVRDAHNARDYDALRRLLADDFHQEDHRAMGAGPIRSSAEYLAMIAGIVPTPPPTCSCRWR